MILIDIAVIPERYAYSCKAGVIQVAGDAADAWLEIIKAINLRTSL